MIKKDINLFFITSVINNFLPSLYFPEERLDQTIRTINSIKNKVKNPYIVILEGSTLSESQIQQFKNAGADELLNYNVSGYNKSDGEATLIISYLNSNFYEKLINDYNIQTCNKFSGRYYFMDEHDFYKHPLDSFLIAKKETNTWSNKPLCETRYYRFPFSHASTFKEKMNNLKKTGIYIDMEHTFYHYNILPLEKVSNIDKLYVSGNIAPDGNLIID